MDVNTPPRSSVFGAFREALTLTRRRLFRPFRFTEIVRLGFLAFLGSALQIGIFTFNFGLLPSSRRPLEEARDAQPFLAFFLQNLGLIVLTLGLILITYLFLRLLWIYMRCRGRFVFLDCLLDPAKSIPHCWQKNGPSAASLFRWKLFTGLLGFLFFIAVAVTYVLLALQQGTLGQFTSALLTAAVTLAVMGVIVTALSIFLEDFVVPLMWGREVGVMAGWGAFFGLFAQRPLAFLGYAVLRTAVSVAAFFLIAVVSCLTCCLAVIPVIGEVVLIPLHTFIRLWPLILLAQLDPAFRRRLTATAGSPPDVNRVCPPPVGGLSPVALEPTGEAALSPRSSDPVEGEPDRAEPPPAEDKE